MNVILESLNRIENNLNNLTHNYTHNELDIVIKSRIAETNINDFKKYFETLLKVTDKINKQEPITSVLEIYYDTNI